MTKGMIDRLLRLQLTSGIGSNKNLAMLMFFLGVCHNLSLEFSLFVES